MKKSILIIISFVLLSFLSGCGQKMDVTVYNTSGLTYNALSQVYIQMSASLDSENGTNNTMFPTEVALNDSACNANNSFTIKSNENQTLSVFATGYKYSVDTDGLTTLVKFTAGPTTKVIYGEFMHAPHWYAAVYTDNIVIYQK